MRRLFLVGLVLVAVSVSSGHAGSSPHPLPPYVQRNPVTPTAEGSRFASLRPIAGSSPSFEHRSPAQRRARIGDTSAVPPYVVAYSTPPMSFPFATSLFALRADGSAPLQLTSGDWQDFPSGWSPDGSRLLFERWDNMGVYSSVWEVGLDGAAPVALSSGDYGELPAWSPDGTLVAYQEQTDYGTGGGRADTSFDLYVVHPDGTAQTKIDAGGTDGSSADWVGDGSGWDWSPDSKRIAVVEPDPTSVDPETGEERQRLAVVDVGSGAARVVARVAVSDGLPDAYDGWVWSPQGRWISFVRRGGKARIGVLSVLSRKVVRTARVATREVLYQGSIPSSLAEYGIGWAWASRRELAVVQSDRAQPKLLRLAIVDAATGRVWQIPTPLSTRVVDQTSLVTQWTSSPNGREIALFARRPRSSVPNVVVADLVRHTTTIIGAGTEATWSPDGRRLAIAVTAPTPACGGLRTASPHGGPAAAVVTAERGACDHGIEWTDNGKLIVFTRSQRTTDTSFVVAPDGSGLRPLIPVPAASVQWPADCRQALEYEFGYDWLLPDGNGTLQLVRRPQLPADAYQSWRC